jgi:hypothetical protein
MGLINVLQRIIHTLCAAGIVVAAGKPIAPKDVTCPAASTNTHPPI